MKKCVCLMLILVIGLISCGDDDKPSLPKLNKLTKNTLRPITPDLVNPLNSLYGTSNRNLPESASRYSLGESKNGAEYTFRYQTVGDYITGMVITEDIKSVEGLDAGQNTYEYSFVYNYETN